MKKVEITDDTGNKNAPTKPNINNPAYSKVFLFIILGTLFSLKV